MTFDDFGDRADILRLLGMLNVQDTGRTPRCKSLAAARRTCTLCLCSWSMRRSHFPRLQNYRSASGHAGGIEATACSMTGHRPA